MTNWHDFHGPNAGYVLELYERYRQNPASVDEPTRAFFGQWTPPADGAAARGVAAADAPVAQILGAANLAQAIRSFGYLAAQIDPLGSPPLGDPALDLDAHDLTEQALRDLPASLVGGPAAETAANALEAVETLRTIYCSTSGYDFEHVTRPDERSWLRDAVETGRYRDALADPARLLDRLTQVETFEQFLHRIFPGKHRFSIEGLDILIPMIDELVCAGAEQGIGSILVGMAHRGRVNVLAHVLHKSYRALLAAFKDPLVSRRFRDDLGWTGDVQYHKGGYLAAADDRPCSLTIALAPNPSHLEAVNPVVAGMVRAAGSKVDQPGPPGFDPATSLPLVIHGDASFPAQGVVAETLNLSRLPGYWVGGTLHIIANNQLGFTTLPEDARSTWYASTLAKGFRMPIIHVNADDPEACLEAVRIAFAFQSVFQKDFVIDLVGYRRWGHNEGDEPSFTQPLMYETIRRHPTVRALWAETLSERGLMTPEQADQIVREHMDALQAVFDSLEPAADLSEVIPEPPPPGTARRVKTGIAIKRLKELNDALLTLPDGFHLHPKIARVMDRRRENLADPDALAVDWSTAEALALASILQDGIAVRLTGQDVERGTFSQRHAIFHDQKTGEAYTPLQSIPQAKASFEVHNSPLTENAAIGFEYGYNIQAPDRLVIWEAQYGDFINGAQVVIDEFISSARSKWGQTPSLVLLLPHGYEGAGPDHSSGRLERFLQLTGETNMRITNPSTAAQFFHLLRRQAALLTTDPLPLIVMTPKSLLRQPLVYSTLRDLAGGAWQPVLDDADAQARADDVRRMFLCSGKVWVDLVASEQRAHHPDIAIVRVEQLYPFPSEALGHVLESYPQLQELVWVQEEPQNMGAWTFVQPHLLRLANGRWPLCYVGRASSASPAEGSRAAHEANQEKLVQQAYEGGPDPIDDDFIIS